jgi:hypothetical protein
VFESYPNAGKPPNDHPFFIFSFGFSCPEMVMAGIIKIAKRKEDVFFIKGQVQKM